MKKIVNENEKGFLFKNGRLIKLLEPGKYHIGKNAKIEKYLISNYISKLNCNFFEKLMSAEGASKALITLEVADNECCLHYLDGNFMSLLLSGKYAFWKERGRHEFKKINKDEPEIGNNVTPFELAKIPASVYSTVNVGSHEKARLYYDNRLVKILEPGRYYFWNGKVNVTAEPEDMRIRRLTIDGQEILTKDRVGIRVNFVMNFKVTDAEKVADVADHNIYMYLYSLSQLVLREYVGQHSIDEILCSRESIENDILNAVRERSGDAYVLIESAGIKDIILPGEISAIMNSVLAAEKKAQANVITRREEVASTRSLLNTAKLLEENDTLRRLKELEYLERICEHVGEINVGGGSDILGKLTELLIKEKKD